MGPAGFEPATSPASAVKAVLFSTCALHSRSTSAPQAELQPHKIRKPVECF